MQPSSTQAGKCVYIAFHVRISNQVPFTMVPILYYTYVSLCRLHRKVLFVLLIQYVCILYEKCFKKKNIHTGTHTYNAYCSYRVVFTAYVNRTFNGCKHKKLYSSGVYRFTIIIVFNFSPVYAYVHVVYYIHNIIT